MFSVRILYFFMRLWMLKEAVKKIVKLHWRKKFPKKFKRKGIKDA